MMMNGKDLVGSSRSLTLRYHPSICLGLRKNTKTLNLDSRSPGQRIEHGNSKIRSRGVNHLTTTLGHETVISEKNHEQNSKAILLTAYVVNVLIYQAHTLMTSRKTLLFLVLKLLPSLRHKW
jgi:hypothetical protein